MQNAMTPSLSLLAPRRPRAARCSSVRLVSARTLWNYANHESLFIVPLFRSRLYQFLHGVPRTIPTFPRLRYITSGCFRIRLPPKAEASQVWKHCWSHHLSHRAYVDANMLRNGCLANLAWLARRTHSVEWEDPITHRAANAIYHAASRG